MLGARLWNVWRVSRVHWCSVYRCCCIEPSLTELKNIYFTAHAQVDIGSLSSASNSTFGGWYMKNQLPKKFSINKLFRTQAGGMSWLAILEMRGLVVMSLAWMFSSYCKLWLWLNRRLKWHFLFLSPVNACFAQFLPFFFLFLTPSLARCLLQCVKPAEPEMCHQSSVLWAWEGERAALQTGLLLQVWDQRPRLHWNPSHSTPHPTNHSCFFNPTLFYHVLFFTLSQN